jgi:phospholipid/cholesterol/gamma-HCH transport system permease protein
MSTVTSAEIRGTRGNVVLDALGRTGSAALEVLQVLGEATTLFVATVRRGGLGRTDRGRLAHELVRVGTDTLPIAALLSLFVGMVLVVQTADQVREVSQGVLGPIVGLAMTKELGPTMMAFLLAGRAGSAMAAELGAMSVYDEIAALRTLDVDPVRFLVQPRVIAATIALPILVLYADFIGVAGGAAVVRLDPAIKISVDEYLARMLEWVHLRDVLIGLGKGAVFGLITAVVSCTWGLRTRGGADRIATSTTAAVVWSFVLILVFDFIIVRASFMVTS